MPFPRLLLLFAASFLLARGVSMTRDQGAPAKQQGDDKHNQSPKPVSKPFAPFPEDAARKHIEGKVTLRIVIDAKGNVSEAKALSGPAELVPAAVASVKMWKFEPPAHPPVTTTTSITYSFQKECPGPISDIGAVMGSGRLLDARGKLIAVYDGDDYRLPRYPDSERKAGVTGKMVLSVSLRPDGQVEEIHALKSLSPGLDKVAIDTVRPLKFKPVDPSSTAPLDDLRLEFLFTGECMSVPE